MGIVLLKFVQDKSSCSDNGSVAFRNTRWKYFDRILKQNIIILLQILPYRLKNQILRPVQVLQTGRSLRGLYKLLN